MRHARVSGSDIETHCPMRTCRSVVGLDTLSWTHKFHAAHPELPDRVHGPRGRITRPTLQENVMKRLAFVAAVLAVAATACSKSEQAKTDTTPPAMAPAPAPAPTAADTGMKMDTTHKMDTTMKKDTTKKP